MAIATVNPATGELLASFDAHDASEVEHRLTLAAAASRSWRRESFAARAAVVRRAGEILELDKERWARLMVLEMGKPIRAALAEAEKCAWVCRFYAEEAERFLASESVPTDARSSGVRFDPLGVVLAVMPWNFPFWQVFRFAAPALMAGNVGLLKHASNVPQCALAIEEIFLRAGAPEGAFQTLLVPASGVAALIADPRVAAATLTGSEPAGMALGASCGTALKKCVLELGGSDPFIVLPSADLPRAVATAVTARTINNGQSCIAAKRFLVHREVYSSFAAEFVARMAALRLGDPFDPATEVGPLATEAILLELEDQVARSVASGAQLLLGGKRHEGAGYFFPPTVLGEVPRDTPAALEELFGPVAPIFPVDSLDDAIDLANATPFGLGAAAWTSDEAEQQRLVAEIEAGSVFLNGMVKSDPRLPFGGIKRSGFGRELAAFGIREFTNVKAVWIG